MWLACHDGLWAQTKEIAQSQEPLVCALSEGDASLDI